MTDRKTRVYRSLLVLYPLEYRRHYGDPMTQLFVDRLRDEGGGARTLLVWVQMLVDLTKSALAERWEATMRSFRTDWWRILVIPLSLLIAVAGVGLPFEPQDTAGPNWQVGAIAYAVAAVMGFGLVIAGSSIRRKNRNAGSNMIAVGVIPGFPMAIMLWYPPIALVGLLSIAISIAAFVDAPKAPQSLELAEPAAQTAGHTRNRHTS